MCAAAKVFASPPTVFTQMDAAATIMFRSQTLQQCVLMPLWRWCSFRAGLGCAVCSYLRTLLIACVHSLFYSGLSEYYCTVWSGVGRYLLGEGERQQRSGKANTYKQ